MTWAKGEIMRSIPYLLLVVILGLAPSADSADWDRQPSAAPSKQNQAEVVLRWVSHAQLPWEEKNEEHCHKLVIFTNGQAQYGRCNQKPKTEKMLFESNIMRFFRHFAPFEYRSSTATLSFYGRGNIKGDVWPRTIETWTSHSYSNLYTGHVCAACGNVLEWSFAIPDRPEYTGMLIVREEGYATKLCIHADNKHRAKNETVTDGWLTTDEWTQLYNWVQNRRSQANYDRDAFCRKTQCVLAGNGTEDMSPLEFDALKEWARKVYDRMQ
jgi:hypothetical protein